MVYPFAHRVSILDCFAEGKVDYPADMALLEKLVRFNNSNKTIPLSVAVKELYRTNVGKRCLEDLTTRIGREVQVSATCPIIS